MHIVLLVMYDTYTSFHSAHVRIQAYKIDGDLVCCTAVPENPLHASVCIVQWPFYVRSRVAGQGSSTEYMLVLWFKSYMYTL